jgi:hypothetical protein
MRRSETGTSCPALYGCGPAMLALAAVMPAVVVVRIVLSLRRAAR